MIDREIAVEVRGLTLGYEDAPPLLTDFTMEVACGEVVAVRGDSGCGKSTLLHCICGLIPGSVKAEMSGQVLLFGKDITEYGRAEMARCLGIVFQNPDTQLFCDTVEDELAFGLENLCLERDDMAGRIKESLELIGLERYRLTSPNQLSGGQKQLVVLAAVMAMRPRLLLLDEALSQMDDAAKAVLLDRFERLKKQGQTILMVDHDEANLWLADRVVRLHGER